MQTLLAGSPAFPAPIWLRATAFMGVLWNAFGVYQFANSFTEAGRAAMTASMTTTQAQAYLSLPSWVTLAFAVGAVGGLIGTLALLAKRRVAQPILLTSFVGYCLLFSGDYYYGVFDGAPGQLLILSTVVLIAAAMLSTAWFAQRRGLLR